MGTLMMQAGSGGLDHAHSGDAIPIGPLQDPAESAAEIVKLLVAAGFHFHRLVQSDYPDLSGRYLFLHKAHNTPQRLNRRSNFVASTEDCVDQ